MPEPRMPHPGPLNIENPGHQKPPEPVEKEQDTGVPLEEPPFEVPEEPGSTDDDVTQESHRGSFDVPRDNVTEETTIDFTI